MKIAIIGNSHVASLKSGWDYFCSQNESNASSAEITYFAAAGRLLWDLEVESTVGDSADVLSSKNNKLNAALEYSSGGIAKIDLTQYDCCVLHGLMRFPRYDLRISEQLKSIVLKRLVTNSLANHVATSIRSFSDIPLYITPKPLLVWSNSDYLSKNHTYKSYQDTFDDVLNTKFAKNIHMIPQPHETIQNEISTPDKYAKNSTRMRVFENAGNEARIVSDIAHMNEQYGLLQLEKLGLLNIQIAAA